MALTFVKCKECETIIEIKDLDVPFTEELLEQANESNTIRGNDLCAVCGQKAIQPEEESEETPEGTSEQETTEEETPEQNSEEPEQEQTQEQQEQEQISEEENKEEPAEEDSGENNNK